jgi:hypothetical protein
VFWKDAVRGGEVLLFPWVFRSEHPVLYWGTMSLYLLMDVILLAVLLFHIFVMPALSHR